jgi:L-fuconolactonase
MRIDSHVHLWDEAHSPAPWMTQEHAVIARPFGPNDLLPLITRNGVDAVILVQGSTDDPDTDYLLAEAARHHWIAAVTAWVCLDEPSRAGRRLDELARHPKLRAVRHLTQDEPDGWLLREPVLESIALLQQHGLMLEVPLEYPRHFDDVAELAHRFPDLPIVVDHLGKPPIGRAEMTDWRRALEALAAAENVHAKVSGLNTTMAWADWTASDLGPAIQAALDCFGPDRLMCGSDWPVALLNGDYDRAWGTASEVLAACCPGHADALLGENAVRIYRLDGDTATDHAAGPDVPAARAR